MKVYSDHLSESAVHNLERWLREDKYAEYHKEIEQMIEHEAWKDLEDAFFKVIEFGTGGRRGMTGPGSNRINRVTVGESAQALCSYAKSVDPDAPTKGIAIACDTRLSSPELSRYAACVCAANGFKTYIFDSFRSTPELSFAVRELSCAAGIVVSASHNPPSDNGFKAYWNDGGQLVSPHDKGVLAVAEEIHHIDALADYEAAVASGEIVELGKEMDEKYIAAVVNEAEGDMRDVKIAYSPLHGAGQTNTLPVLRAAGFSDIVLVEDQMVPDGNFPTIENNKPNPEEKAANDRVVALMLAEDADIAITNDPDADRIGVMVRQGEEAIYLSGNQSAVLATDYVLRKKQSKRELTNKDFIAKTIVTSDMLAALAAKYNVKVYGNLLIGFKYIGELIRLKEAEGERYIIGGEESFGLSKGTYVRDKDGAAGALPLAEYAAELKREGKTLWDRMLELYGEHGLYLERLDTMVCPGAEGFEQMTKIMASLRENAPEHIAGERVTAVLDYSTLVREDVASGTKEPIDCVKGNVITLEFGESARRVTIRPSGTEPKLKFYVQWRRDTEDVEVDYEVLSQHLENISRELEGIAFERVE